MLVVVSGLPGTGKTTLAQALATRWSAVYLRIDVIEQAIRSARDLTGGVGPVGYVVANALAASNLGLGHRVIADCVNPVQESREGWRGTARQARAKLLEVEVVCSDTDEHRHRVETRVSDIEGLLVPTWQAVLDRDYAPWPEPHLIVDTARLTPEAALTIVERASLTAMSGTSGSGAIAP